jgi:hypothetical protein
MARSNRLGARRLVVAGLTALALIGGAVAPVPSAHAEELKSYRDKAWKFSASFPASWDQVPLEPGEKEIVAKFSEKKADAKGIRAAEGTVYRLGTGTKPVVTDGPASKPGEPGEPDEPGMDAPPAKPDFSDFFKPATDLVEKANEQFERWKVKARIDRKAGKASPTKDGVPGQVWFLEVKPDWGSTFDMIAVWEKPGEKIQLGLWLQCSLDRRKKLEPIFQQVVKSFRWHDDKAKDVQTIAALDGLPITPAKRLEIERGLVAGWNVIVSPRRNYIVMYNTVKSKNHLLAKVIAERIEAIREQVYEKQFPPKKKIEDVCIVRVCGGRAEYHAYGGPGGSAGYWSSWHEELVFYDASPARAPDDDTISVLYHEAFHQYIYYSAGRVSPHSWFNEGHGDYYAGAKYVGGKFLIKPFTWRVGTIKNAIRAGASPVGEGGGGFDRTKGGYTPLDRLCAFSQGEYYSYPDVCYAQGWSLVFFLREIVPKNPKWNAKWGKILDIYFATLQGSATNTAKPEPKPEPGDPNPGMDTPPAGPGDDEDPADAMGFARPTDFGEGGGNLQKALEEAFRGVDWKELEEAWRTSILGVS